MRPNRWPLPGLVRAADPGPREDGAAQGRKVRIPAPGVGRAEPALLVGGLSLGPRPPGWCSVRPGPQAQGKQTHPTTCRCPLQGGGPGQDLELTPCWLPSGVSPSLGCDPGCAEGAGTRVLQSGVCLCACVGSGPLVPAHRGGALSSGLALPVPDWGGKGQELPLCCEQEPQPRLPAKPIAKNTYYTETFCK